MSFGKTLTFCQLFDGGRNVEIPIIQRDYAHGRDSAVDVRTNILKDIYKTLSQSPDTLERPLDLDFIYGVKKVGNPEKFVPLDGQQRLTTMFLLHWYLAWKDGKRAHFKSLICDGENARFTYQTRQSSKEFFDALANDTELDLAALFSPDEGKNNALSKTIEDKCWYFLSWRDDPTIKSALTVLDDIHTKFSNTNGFYDKLVNVEKPFITFKLLDLEDIYSPDDLYIKMNARCKLLTPFETLKAKLEQLIARDFPNEQKIFHDKSKSLSAYFSDRIDTDWLILSGNTSTKIPDCLTSK